MTCSRNLDRFMAYQRTTSTDTSAGACVSSMRLTCSRFTSQCIIVHGVRGQACRGRQTDRTTADRTTAPKPCESVQSSSGLQISTTQPVDMPTTLKSSDLSSGEAPWRASTKRHFYSSLGRIAPPCLANCSVLKR